MRVPEDWDRPCGRGSYYPPLRCADLLEKPGQESPRPSGGGCVAARPVAPAPGADGCCGPARGPGAGPGSGDAGPRAPGSCSAALGGGAFGAGAFGGGAFGCSTSGGGAPGGGVLGGSAFSSAAGHASRATPTSGGRVGDGGLGHAAVGTLHDRPGAGGDYTGVRVSPGNFCGNDGGVAVPGTYAVLRRDTSSSSICGGTQGGLNFSFGGASASAKVGEQQERVATSSYAAGALHGGRALGPGDGSCQSTGSGTSGVRDTSQTSSFFSSGGRESRQGTPLRSRLPFENGSGEFSAREPAGTFRSAPTASPLGASGSTASAFACRGGPDDARERPSAPSAGRAGLTGCDFGGEPSSWPGGGALGGAAGGCCASSGWRSAPTPAPEPGPELQQPPAPGAPAEQGVEVRGSGEVPGCWRSWEDVAFPQRVRAPLISAGFPAPTLIQQYAWPICMHGRDLIGIAKTGSGKTLSFLLPAFARLFRSHADPRGPPAILVLAPTRELACQIEAEAKRFGEAAGMRAACLYGGAPKGPQLAELRQRPQVLVATPGRLNDLLEPAAGLSVAVDVKGIQYLVLDEADRMLDMGFEPQIRKIIRGLPQDRQTLMFTATWPAAVRRLAMEFMRDPVEVRAGEADELRVNPDVEQRVILCADSRDKEDRLEDILREAGEDQAVIFVNTKRMCELVAMRVDNSVVIHGDKDQRERDQALGLFKSGSRRVLVATDVAARGLDIKSIRLVVNFDPPNREEDYVHRVGRTGRAGKKGRAVTLLTNDDGTAARSIMDIFRRMELPVPEELERRLASGEMRQGGGRGGGRDGPRRLGVGRRGGDMGFGDDFDFDNMAGGRFSSGFGARRRDDDFPGTCFNDCPT
uniref:RNA helicase n=1 Tax=Alexandrium monilatum TaxID=311494 RepID=A0A7S4W3W1_9DINO